MIRYFKVVEIERYEFRKAVHDDIHFGMLVAPSDDAVFVAVDDETEIDFIVWLDCFE